MANPASITVTALALNAGTNHPAVQTIDTDGTVPVTLAGDTANLIFELVNAAAAAVTVTFKAEGDDTMIIETFDPETENSPEMQRAGWQSIMDNFKSYVERS